MAPTLDYSIKMRDGAGRTIVLCINGASIDEAIDGGETPPGARELTESDAFARAIARGEIGADAWVQPE